MCQKVDAAAEFHEVWSMCGALSHTLFMSVKDQVLQAIQRIPERQIAHSLLTLISVLR
jgi:hypothetical protein